jgi:hypothetical protein
LELTRKEKDEILQKQEKEKHVLVDERREKDEVVSKLKAREKEINSELTAKAKADKKLRDGIAAAVRREMDKARIAAAAAAKKEEATAPKTLIKMLPAPNHQDLKVYWKQLLKERSFQLTSKRIKADYHGP